MQFFLDVGLADFHQQARDFVLHPHPFAHQEVAVAQHPPQLANLLRRHVAERQQIAAQQVADFVGVEAVVLLFGASDGLEHQRVGDLEALSPRPQFVLDPSR